MTISAQTKKIGVYSATAIVIANMVGTGVFTSLGFQVMGIQSVFALLMLWIIGGVMALCGALSYAELGASIPRSGGEYTYLSKIYHPAIGFLSGWVSVIVGFAAPIALAAMALGGYLGTVFTGIDFNLSLPFAENGFIHVFIPQKVWIASSVVIIITLVHTINLFIGSRFQNVFTSVKLLLILGFIGAGLFLGEHQPITVLPVEGSFREIWSGAFFVSLIFVSYAYSGWNASTYLASEIKNPQKSLPKSLLLGTIIVLFLYVLLNFVFLYSVPIPEMHDAKGPIVEIGSLSANKIFGETGGNIMSMLISVLLISTISSMVFAGPRVTMAIGEDLPALKIFAKKSKRGIPVISIVLQSIIALILIFTSSFGAVMTYLGFTLALFTSLTVVGLFILRVKQPDLPRPFKTWGYPVTPAIFLLLNIGILYYSLSEKRDESLAGIGTVLLGLIVYFISKYYSDKSTITANAEKS